MLGQRYFGPLAATRTSLVVIIIVVPLKSQNATSAQVQALPKSMLGSGQLSRCAAYRYDITITMLGSYTMVVSETVSRCAAYQLLPPNT